MTTIVGDWTRKILVSDTQYSDDDTGIKYNEDKVFPIEGGWFGGAGHKSDIEKVYAWIKGKSKTKPKLKNTNSFLKLIMNIICILICFLKCFNKCFINTNFNRDSFNFWIIFFKNFLFLLYNYFTLFTFMRTTHRSY